MKYDQAYPGVSDEFVGEWRDNRPPVVKLHCTDEKCESTHTCCMCGEVTDWVNLAAKVRVCSDECNERVWKQTLATFVAQQIMTGA